MPIEKSEVFPLKLSEEQFKNYMRSSYKSGSLDSLQVIIEHMKSFLNGGGVPEKDKEGYKLAILHLEAAKLEAEFYLVGDTMTHSKRTTEGK